MPAEAAAIADLLDRQGALAAASACAFALDARWAIAGDALLVDGCPAGPAAFDRVFALARTRFQEAVA